MNFSTFKERDTMVDMVAIGDVVKKKEMKFLHFVALFLAFEAWPPFHWLWSHEIIVPFFEGKEQPTKTLEWQC